MYLRLILVLMTPTLSDLPTWRLPLVLKTSCPLCKSSHGVKTPQLVSSLGGRCSTIRYPLRRRPLAKQKCGM
jgi:hypothetical protein